MELNREQIIKALELHSLKLKPCLQDCPYGGLHYCGSEMAKDALSLIKELTEENERLRKLGTTKEVEKEIVRRETRADTVRKMQERLKEVSHMTYDINSVEIEGIVYVTEIDQITKEMIGEAK